eukprot:TRINITY_DN5232_c0_g1_i1.p3 TRINITY_DN5232_c0_g1~~TRINITY_DN5232_c0_g1_i1.p3  ORF type:complete len:143 (-),score=2.46 TRINITY_DN5232_c0_g1_i1:145-573(-)
MGRSGLPAVGLFAAGTIAPRLRWPSHVRGAVALGCGGSVRDFDAEPPVVPAVQRRGSTLGAAPRAVPNEVAAVACGGEGIDSRHDRHRIGCRGVAVCRIFYGCAKGATDLCTPRHVGRGRPCRRSWRPSTFGRCRPHRGCPC